MQAPHIVVTVYAAGVAYALTTRLYFADDPLTDDDPLLQNIPEERRHSLLATREERDQETVYRFDIVVRAENPGSEYGLAETVFLEMH